MDKLDKDEEKILIEYVKEQRLDETKDANKVIHEVCSRQDPLTKTIYRGHNKDRRGNDRPVIAPGLWYSATTDIDVASRDFAGENCCIFEIHLQDVPCIIINDFIGDKIGDKNEENEIIFLGGGTFYKNVELTEEGYLETNHSNKRMFKCWYSLQPPKIQKTLQHNGTDVWRFSADVRNNVDRALSIIGPDEYADITNISDIIIDIELTDAEKQQVLDEIQKRKPIGGRKKRTKIRKTKQNRKNRKTYKKRRLKY